MRTSENAGGIGLQARIGAWLFVLWSVLQGPLRPVVAGRQRATGATEVRRASQRSSRARLAPRSP